MLLPSSNLLQQRHIQSQPQIQQSRFPGIVDNDIVSDPFVVDEISPSGFGQDLYSLTQPRQPATYLSSRQLTVPSHPHTVDPSKFSLFSTATSPSTSDDYLSLSQLPDLMSSESWPLASHYTPKSFGRMPHQRESSLSSLGSAGPASPYNHTVTNPHIATAEPASDGFSDMQAHDGSNSYYQLTKAVGSQGGMFSGYHNLNTMEHPEMGYPAAITLHRPRTDRTGLLPAPDFGNGHNRSRPTSVASSTVGGDSPATPSLGEPGDDDRRRMRMSMLPTGRFTSQGLRSPRHPAALTEPPKLDRTMTDIYSDELYNPSFTITSASPSHPQQMVLSPSNDVFAQRLSAANNQHLSASQSPTSSVSRDRSPFRHGSPHAPMSQEFGGVFATSRLRFNSAHEMREHDKAAQDARMLKQQIATKAEPETPRTISPKDAMLDFPGPDSESVFPSLFPTQETTSDFGANDQTSKSTASTSQLALFPQHQHQHNSGYSYLPHQQLPASVHIPQQYPFIAHPHQSHHESPPNLTSAGSSTGSSVNTPVNAKPAGATADGGTYTCTYHGCSLRFETPALLQKHKREGHRQPQGLAAGGIRHSDGDSSVSDSFLNTQAGPHRCDRVNPSTGKPCNTIFSRPYDLTRHEDTIHNARKQKVRCNLCTEEKTFSRADALTRHYRVCHPDVELPGKYRRRGHHG